MTGYFKLTEGYVDCPKCGGWQIIDKTKRGPTGWPLEAILIESCDHCGGRGEIKGKAVAIKAVISPWGKAAEPVTVPTAIWDIDDPEPPSNVGWGEKPLEPGPIKIEGWGTPPEPDPVAKGWKIFDEGKDNV